MINSTLAFSTGIPSSSPLLATRTASQQHHRLDQLSAGVHGIVHQIGDNHAAMERLKAMGLCVGREVEVVRDGNPLIIRFLGARVGVSDRLAQEIVIEHHA